MPNEEFQAGRTYENVYIIVADSSGYSSIVRSNPRDRAAHAFDLLRERVTSRVQKLAAELGCARTKLWSWRGDGGLIVVHDDDESTTRDVALRAALDILLVDLPSVREELSSTELNGELRLRIAVHKGTIPYSHDSDNGSVHSPDINFVAHLEEATPPDCLTISEDVYQAAGPHARTFAPVGTYERRDIYLRAVDPDPRSARRAWIMHNGLAGQAQVMASIERPSQQEKARLVAVANTEVIDLGTALRTATTYLNTTERPATYRDAVLEFLARGGTYRCVLLDPVCDTTRILSQYRREDLAEKIRASVKAFSAFKDKYNTRADRFEVYYSKSFPGFSAIIIDLPSENPQILYAPYLMNMREPAMQVDNGDTPHYLATPVCRPVLEKLTTILQPIVAPDQLERLM
ncbi:adenylate/guanylate cyclase domain-containing protein [Actinophytocola xanthii]|uniref:adenylate/guanylate cyclase domain-containing protein n=1 Tax=Actinophytocola xanthii TaxID=1912961 RepID=UPI0011780CC2|nr:adenylate/guanylate cyclase domain-containing protein [Actinophytocola xanthii]